MDHKLIIERNVVGIGYDGTCSCSDPDWNEGWIGHVVFHGESRSEIEEYFADHVIEATA